MRHVTASLHDVLWLDLESCRVVNLLEVAREVALMIVLPFEKTRDLIDEFRCLYALSSLVHCAKVAALQRRIAIIIEESSTGVACLVGTSAPNDV